MHLVPSLEVQHSSRKVLWASHLRLAEYNQSRLAPRIPGPSCKKDIVSEAAMLTLEGEVLEIERQEIGGHARRAPQTAKDFMHWFEELKQQGPGQNDPLFPWLAEKATHAQMKWFVQQEVAGEAGFEDLTALAQIKMPSRAKLEMARNYWDEMGRGHERGMHGPMLAALARELEIPPPSSEEVVVEALALGNLMLGMAMNRRYAYHAVGALGVIEMTAPDRALAVYQGLKRLNLSAEAQRYYLLHSTLDKKHSEAWNKEVIEPLVNSNPHIIRAIAEGALMRLNSGARCFNRYRKELWTH